MLYEQGQSGIQGWIDKVHQQGRRSETAAKLTDNLAGDLERFTGSVETAFIQAGSGGNDALRALVQRATSVVNALGEIPGPATLATGALAALALVGPKAFLSFRQYKSDLDAAGVSIAKISERAPRLGRGLDIASKAAKGLGVALAASVAASAAFDGEIDHIGTKQLTRDLLSSADAAGVLNAALAVNTGTGTQFASGIDSLGAALAETFNPSTASR